MHRSRNLSALFALFDPDGTGSMDARRLLLIGRARRALGHKHALWSPEASNKLMESIGADSLSNEGRVTEAEFVEYFSESLPVGKEDFGKVIDELRDVATYLKDR